MYRYANGFYAYSKRDSYEANGVWPETGVDIGEAEHAILMAAQVDGMRIQADADGYPVAVPPPPPSVQELAALHQRKKTELLCLAAEAIAPLQDASDLGIVTPLEADALRQWKQYRVALHRLDITMESPAWPPPPG